MNSTIKNDTNSSYINTQLEKLEFKTSSELDFLRIILVILSRVGFILIESGCVPTEQFYDLLLPNIVDFSISTASYGIIGSILSFGKDSLHGIIGYGNYTSLLINKVIYGYSIVIFGSGIITSTLSSRLHFIAYTIIIFIYSGITQPILLHWVYNPNGWMKENIIWNHTVVLHDFGSGLVLNLTSGLISIMGLIILGRRLLLLNNIDEYSLGSESPLLVTLGYFFILIGYISISTMKNEEFLILNIILAISGGGLASIMVELFVKKLTFNFWLITRLLQGNLIGLTFTSSFIDIIYPPISFLLAFIGGCIISLTSKLIFNLAIQDYCNVFSVFLLPGIWTHIIQGIIITIGANYKSFGSPLYNFIWSILCILVILFFILSIYAFIFLLLWCMGFLRNETEIISHKRALNMLKYTEQCPLYNIIDVTEEDDILEPGISGKTPNEMVHKAQQDENLKYFRIKKNLNRLDDGLNNKNIYTICSDFQPSDSHPLSGGDKADGSKTFINQNIKCGSKNLEL